MARICASTWNVGGRVPPDDLDIDGWLDVDDPADVYVIGLQEIIPLNAGNIFGAKDRRPVSIWENRIRETLNKIPQVTKFRGYSNPPSPSRFKPSEDAPNMDEILKIDSDIEEEICPLNEESNFVNEVKSNMASLAKVDPKRRINRKKGSPYIKIVDRQMVGIFLTIWVRRSMRRHIQNLNVSSVGVGAMGFIGNKGSISVSMSIHQTLFCFICTHLTSGQKDADAAKRIADVQEIHRRTSFNSHSSIELRKRIHDHERIIWLGDLNYRINLSYEKTRELILKEDRAKLVEHDQLIGELRKGRAFDGWSEDNLNFAPTYKYQTNLDTYCGEDSRTRRCSPAWCDRILSSGKGMKLLSYTRSELRLSNHRPVTASYMVEVEVFSPRKLQRALTFIDAEIAEEDVELAGN